MSNSVDGLNPLLLDAKREYMTRLSEVVSPFVIKFLDTAYAAALDECGHTKALLAFQKVLRQVPLWNAAQIKDTTQKIENKYSFLGDLIAAVFVSYVKVLSSIRISTQRPNVKLRLPTNDAFIHKVFETTARAFYENPQAIHDRLQKQKLVNCSIEMAVRDMLPLKDVLQAYLSTAVDDDQTFNPVLSPTGSPVKQPSSEKSYGEVEPSEEDEEETYDAEPKTIMYQGGAGETGEMPAPVPAPYPPTAPPPAYAGPPPAPPLPSAPLSAPPAAPPPSTHPPPANFFGDAEDDEKHF